ncbi:hypothetical protein AMTRI_Chr03g56550 [Amborella trichopoda]
MQCGGRKGFPTSQQLCYLDTDSGVRNQYLSVWCFILKPIQQDTSIKLLFYGKTIYFQSIYIYIHFYTRIDHVNLAHDILGTNSTLVLSTHSSDIPMSSIVNM